MRGLLEALAGGPLPDWSRFDETLEEFHLRVGEFLPTRLADSATTDFYLVVKGLVQVKTTDARGLSTTVNFVGRGDIFASQPAISGGGSSPELNGALPFTAVLKGAARARAEQYIISALQESVIVRCDGDELTRRADVSLPWAKVFATAYRLYALFIRRERDRMRLPPEQRYRSFLRDYAAYTAVIPQKAVAEYLAISEVGLSRIATRVRREHSEGNGATG